MGRVLIVEDNELNLKFFNDLLNILEHETIMSRDGIDLLNIVNSTKPELILMDIHLNGISGIDLITLLKSNVATQHIPIITITAFAMKSDEAKISKSGCNMYLSKPVSIEVFFDAIQKFLPKTTINN